jgi:hypothetical protein
MIGHEEALRLAASAIDFPLSAGEAAELALHRRSCAECRAGESALRSDAAALGQLPFVDAPASVRDAVAWSAAQPARPLGRSRATLLLVAAVLVTSVGVGTALGAALLNRDDETTVLPSTSASAIAAASATPEQSLPPVSALPSASPTSEPSSSPPAQLVLNAWSRVVVEVVNVRESPSLGARIVGTAARDDLVFVHGDEPVQQDQSTWYRVTAAPDLEGWIAGRSQGDENLSAEGVFGTRPWCDVPSRSAFVDALPRVPLLLGFLPIAPDRIGAATLGAFELAWAGQSTFCLDLVIGDGQLISTAVDARVGVCGRWDSRQDSLWLIAGSGDVRPDGSVDRRRAYMHPALLGFIPAESGDAVNLEMLWYIATGAPRDRICVSAEVIGSGDAFSVETIGTVQTCDYVDSIDAGEVWIGGGGWMLRRTPGSVIDPAIEVSPTIRVPLRITAQGGVDGPFTLAPADPSLCD